MTDKICAIVGFYQDRQAGVRLLRNLYRNKIPSIWADSRVEGFMQLNGYDMSTDGLDKEIIRYPNTTLMTLGVTFPGQATVTMMKKAAELGYDYTILLGCDEYIMGDWNCTKSALDYLNLKEPARIRIPIVEHNPSHNNNQAVQGRIVFMPGHVTIKNIHWLYYSNYNGKEKIIGDIRESPVAYGAEIHHDDEIRPRWRNKIMDGFQKFQVERETQEVKKLVEQKQIEKFNKERDLIAKS